MKYLKASVRPLSNISEGWKVSFIRFSSWRNFFFGETSNTFSKMPATCFDLSPVLIFRQACCCVPSTADTGCSVVGSARSTTVNYGTDSRLLHTFIGLNHAIRLTDLLQHLR